MNQIITISREFGAGGHTIGKRVAQELGIEFFDRDIVRETAKASGFDPELIEDEGEDVSRADSILKTICSASSLQFHDTQEVIHDVQQAIIVQLAQKGPCVILGRCADEILREAGIDSLNVFIHADMDFRADRIVRLYGESEKSPKNRLNEKDKRRKVNYQHYTGRNWGEAKNYDLCLKSSTLGIETCADIIAEMAMGANHVESPSPAGEKK